MATGKMTTIKGALFDKDGTLIDFTATWRGLFENMLDDYAGQDIDLRIAIGRAVGFDVATRTFLPGSPVVADTSDVIARLMADLLPGVDAATIEDDANRRAAATGARETSRRLMVLPKPSTRCAPTACSLALAHMTAKKQLTPICTHWVSPTDSTLSPGMTAAGA